MIALNYLFIKNGWSSFGMHWTHNITIVEVKENSVIVQIKGTMHMVASVGVNGQINVDGKAVVIQRLPSSNVEFL